ncbi:hypothetical protein [Agathobaculum desmolans]|uniref:hypothetical protein n=1 Tax=Agathobaculum desmolans TaxID=39484 RepID=UPI00248EF0F6|nr:hypothetical protein [Agathobaculum desmolans]
MENNKKVYNNALFDTLLGHRGHKVYIASYGPEDDPYSVVLECEDCGAVVLDSELYTLCAREEEEE